MGQDYIARCPKCQSLVCWMSESMVVRDPKEGGKELAKWARDGLSIERMETEAARAAPWMHTDDCPDNKESKRRKKSKQTPLFTTKGAS